MNRGMTSAVQPRSSSYTIAADNPMTDSPAKPRIAIGSDHAGFTVKESIRKYLEEAGYLVDDQGTSSENSVDYPDFGKAVGERVASKKADLGIAVCGSGIGISIAANKVPGIRAALAHDIVTAQLAREHNDANVVELDGKRGIYFEKTPEVEALERWYNREFLDVERQIAKQ